MPEDSTFQPVAELKTNNSDLGLRLTGMNSVLYAKPVDDPMFSAHQQVLIPNQITNDTIFYHADFPGSVMACTIQVGHFSFMKAIKLTNYSINTVCVAKNSARN